VEPPLIAGDRAAVPRPTAAGRCSQEQTANESSYAAPARTNERTMNNPKR